MMMLGLAGALAGCEAPGAKPVNPADSTDTTVAEAAPNTSLEALADRSARPPLNLQPPGFDTPPTDLEREATLAALNLERLMASGAAKPRPPEPPPEDFVFEPTTEFVGPEAIALEPPAPPPQEPFDPTLEMAQRMARLLREPAPGKPRMPDAVALSPIEALEPGILADLEAPDNRIGPRLTAEERQTLIAARDNILASPGTANESLVRALSRLAPPPELKIARAALCTRVTGFGHYDPFPSTTFLHARPIRAIVYVEVEGFMTRPAREGDPIGSGASLAEMLSVDLSQSLSLYQDPGGLLSWHRPARPVVETSRNKRRDFYIIQQIELPSGLSIGRYNLKVTVKDRTTGAEAETILPISIVADRSAQR
jgi:hypothetical protein